MFCLGDKKLSSEFLWKCAQFHRHNERFLFKLGFTSCKAEQPLQGMGLQEKEAQKDKAYRKSIYKEPTVNRCLLILDLKPFTL